ALQTVAFAFEERLEVRAADLLLALDEEFEVHREAAVAELEEPAQRLEVVEHLALVVHRAAREELTVADRRLEGWAHPFVERAHRLHVVMAVHHDRGRPRRMEPLAVYRRVSGCFEHL